MMRFKIVRGEYTGTTDDKADRWYIDDTQSEVVDRRGPGFRTKAEAQTRIQELLRMNG